MPNIYLPVLLSVPFARVLCAIKPGEFTEFHISMGVLPGDVGMLEFKMLQTYEDGEIVRWIDLLLEDSEEPEHPDPPLTLAISTGDEYSSSHSVEAATTEQKNENTAILLLT